MQIKDSQLIGTQGSQRSDKEYAMVVRAIHSGERKSVSVFSAFILFESKKYTVLSKIRL